MKKAIIAMSAMLSISANAATITFDPPPINGGGRIEISYQESGVLFTGDFAHYSTQAGGSASNSSSGVMKLLFGGSMRIEATDSSLFTLKSIDLAEYSRVFVRPKTISFTGYYSNNTSITQSFTTDGIFDGVGGVNDFESFNFLSSFSNLRYVNVNTVIFAMDNLVVSEVPIPSGILLFLSGIGTLAGVKVGKKT